MGYTFKSDAAKQLFELIPKTLNLGKGMPDEFFPLSWNNAKRYEITAAWDLFSASNNYRKIFDKSDIDKLQARVKKLEESMKACMDRYSKQNALAVFDGGQGLAVECRGLARRLLDNHEAVEALRKLETAGWRYAQAVVVSEEAIAANRSSGGLWTEIRPEPIALPPGLRGDPLRRPGGIPEGVARQPGAAPGGRPPSRGPRRGADEEPVEPWRGEEEEPVEPRDPARPKPAKPVKPIE
jgi:hypothetical protein